MAGENLHGFLIRNFWRVKLWQIPACLFSLYMSQDTIEIWMVKFGEPPVIHQIHGGISSTKNSCYMVVEVALSMQQ